MMFFIQLDKNQTCGKAELFQNPWFFHKTKECKGAW